MRRAPVPIQRGWPYGVDPPNCWELNFLGSRKFFDIQTVLIRILPGTVFVCWFFDTVLGILDLFSARKALDARRLFSFSCFISAFMRDSVKSAHKDSLNEKHHLSMEQMMPSKVTYVFCFPVAILNSNIPFCCHDDRIVKSSMHQVHVHQLVWLIFGRWSTLSWIWKAVFLVSDIVSIVEICSPRVSRANTILKLIFSTPPALPFGSEWAAADRRRRARRGAFVWPLKILAAFLRVPDCCGVKSTKSFRVRILVKFANQVIQPCTRKCPRFSSESIYAGNFVSW